MATKRAELIHIDVDRRLGHEWDEWNGKPLPNGGSFDSPPSLFLRWVGIALLVSGLITAAAMYLLIPRLIEIHPILATITWAALGVGSLFVLGWWGMLGLSFWLNRPLLPAWLAERGLFLRVMAFTSRVSGWFGHRDWVENAAIKVYNALALLRVRQVTSGEMLLLVPRCLSRETLDGVLTLAGRHEVAVFVATRGQLARRVIRERRPRAVVAVACERDMVTGLHDVAGKIPVLGLTMTLPNGPCKDAALDLVQLERYMEAFVGEKR
ncbi:MAG: DUF116 domain-containing protein [Gemmatimonadota bacterium]